MKFKLTLLILNILGICGLSRAEGESIYFHHDLSGYEDANFYCFIYSSTGSNANWPGERMTRDDSLTINGIRGGWYVYTVPADFASSGFAMISNSGGNPRYPGDMEPGIPIDGHSLVFTLSSGKWSTSDSAEIKEEDLGGGSGATDDPYLIYDSQQMDRFASVPKFLNSNLHFRLMADIEVSEDFPGIGSWNRPFCGEFDGNGHSIEGLARSETDLMSPAGFFNVVKNADIHDLGICNARADGAAYVGLMIGKAESSTIRRCYSTGSVSVSALCGGGLIGAADDCLIADCYSHANVEGIEATAIGGLVGHSYTDMESCYATGVVKGYNFVAGLCGTNLYSIRRSTSLSPSITIAEHRRHAGTIIGSNVEYGQWKDIYGWNNSIVNVEAAYGINETSHSYNLASYEFYSADSGVMKWDFNDIWRWESGGTGCGLPLLKNISGQKLPADHPLFIESSSVAEASDIITSGIFYNRHQATLSVAAPAASVIVYKIDGEIVLSSCSNNIDCSSLQNGVYIAVAVSPSGNYTLKFAK